MCMTTARGTSSVPFQHTTGSQGCRGDPAHAPWPPPPRSHWAQGCWPMSLTIPVHRVDVCKVQVPSDTSFSGQAGPSRTGACWGPRTPPLVVSSLLLVASQAPFCMTVECQYQQDVPAGRRAIRQQRMSHHLQQKGCTSTPAHYASKDAHRQHQYATRSIQARSMHGRLPVQTTSRPAPARQSVV